MKGDIPEDRWGGLGDLHAELHPLPHGQLVKPLRDGQCVSLSILKIMLEDGEIIIKIEIDPSSIQKRY